MDPDIAKANPVPNCIDIDCAVYLPLYKNPIVPLASSN